MPVLAKYVSGTLVAYSLGESRKLKQAATEDADARKNDGGRGR